MMKTEYINCSCNKEPLILFPSVEDPSWGFACQTCDVIESDKVKTIAIEKWNKAIRKKKLGGLSFIQHQTYEREVLGQWEPRPLLLVSPPEEELKGWTATSIVGMGITNPRSVSLAHGTEETEEERVQRVILSKSW